MAKPGVKAQVEKFNKTLTKRLDDTNFQLKVGGDVYEDTPHDENGENFDVNESDFLELDDRDNIDDDAYNGVIGAEIILWNGSADNVIHGTVLKQARDNLGQPKGTRTTISTNDNWLYIVRMSNGTEQELQHNIIAQNLFSQCDSEGRQYQILEDISDVHHNKSALDKGDPNAKITSKNGNVHLKKMTKGWEFLCTWKDQTQDWVPLKEMIASHPLETAEFVISRDIQDEPAFVWWVENTIKTWKRIIDKVKSRYWKQTHKFGIEVPKLIEEAFNLNAKNRNNYWQRTIDKEMITVCKNSFQQYEDAHGYQPSAQEVRNNPKRYLVGYKEITCHIIFNIKLDGKFTRKARFVADGSKTDWPKSMTYSSVVSRESVCIAFLTAGLNDVDILVCNISGAYLNAPAGEKVWFLAGRKCGGDRDKVMVVVKALLFRSRILSKRLENFNVSKKS